MKSKLFVSFLMLSGLISISSCGPTYESRNKGYVIFENTNSEAKFESAYLLGYVNDDDNKAIAKYSLQNEADRTELDKVYGE